MSDLEGYGKIYESTNWGEGVNNNIGWGNVYADLGAGPVNTIAPVITSDSGNVNRETPPPTLTSTTGTWTGTGVITFAYQWKRDGVSISGATSSTYSLVADDDNKYITCVITATDDEGSKSRSSNALGPVLGIPTALVNPVASGTPEVDEILTTTDGTWQGLPTIAITYQWRRDSVNISGATSNTYTLVSADLDALVDCQVTATNSIRSVSVDSNDLGPVQAAPIIPQAPSISGVPTISGTAKVGETLTATAASATGVPTPTTSWQWERSDNGTTGWASISGATSNTYTAVSADESKYLRVVQTETNTEGSDSANSAATAQVASATDADAQAFINAASITDSTQQTAIDTLVTDLKTAGIWTKMKAIYPIVGGTASSHKFNLKDPRDLDAAFRLTFSSGWTHSSSGATPNGTSAFAQTYFAPNGNLSQNDAHASIYTRTNVNSGTGIDLGSGSDPLSANTDFYLSASYGTYGCISNINGSSFGYGVSQTDSLGLYLSQRTSSNLTSKYKNNVLVHTHNNVSVTPTSGFINLGRNTTSEYSSRELAFVTLGDSLTSTERGDFYTAVQAFQTTLGRQV